MIGCQTVLVNKLLAKRRWEQVRKTTSILFQFFLFSRLKLQHFREGLSQREDQLQVFLYSTPLLETSKDMSETGMNENSISWNDVTSCTYVRYCTTPASNVKFHVFYHSSSYWLWWRLSDLRSCQGVLWGLDHCSPLQLNEQILPDNSNSKQCFSFVSSSDLKISFITVDTLAIASNLVSSSNLQVTRIITGDESLNHAPTPVWRSSYSQFTSVAPTCMNIVHFAP